MPHCISMNKVWKVYRDDSGKEFTALRDLTLKIPSGKLVAVFGKSGSGKTTLLNLLAGLDRPTRGSIAVDGQNLDELGEAGRTMIRRTRLGFVFQFFNLLPTLTVFENVFLSLELAGQTEKYYAYSALEAVGLADKHKRFPDELSGGEQQRVAIARAIVKKPAIILADEPTGNLDSQTGNRILELLTDTCKKQGTTLLMATHSQQTCRFVDTLLRIADGVVQEVDSSSEV